MARTIKKTVTTSTIHALTVDGMGTVRQFDFSVVGKVTANKALALAKKNAGIANVMVKSVDQAETTYVMPLQTFIEYATPIDDTDNDADAA